MPESKPKSKDAADREPLQRTDWSTRLNRSKAADYVIIALVLLPAFIMYYDRYSPDAAVYFTYFKNFFNKPFSFQPGEVAFGATSPLHVLIFAPLHAMFGSWWIFASKVFNFLLVGVGMVALTRAVKGGTRSVLLTALLVLICAGMLISVSQLFETGLAFFVMALLYHDLTERNYERALLLSGLLYLIRPELVFLSVAVTVYVMRQPGKGKQYMPWLLAGAAPILVYHLYMLFATGSLVPPGAWTPIISFIQEPASWLDRLSATMTGLWSAQGLIYLAGGVLILVTVAEWSAPRYTLELLLIAPLVLVYLLVPPGDAIVRYLVPVLPALLAIFVRYIEKELKVQHSIRALVVSLILAHVFGAATLRALPSTSREEVLMSGLANGLNKVTDADDRIMLYDIQSQYQIDSYCYALSGEVGSDLVNVLLRRETMSDFIRQNNVHWLVTSDVLGERALYQNTLLEALYTADAQAAVGDTMFVEGLAFEKQFSNPAFIRRNARPAMRPSRAEIHRDQIPQWNSVFKVLGDEMAVRNQTSKVLALSDARTDATPDAESLREVAGEIMDALQAPSGTDEVSPEMVEGQLSDAPSGVDADAQTPETGMEPAAHQVQKPAPRPVIKAPADPAVQGGSNPPAGQGTGQVPASPDTSS